jgi:histidine ammonia-lyase
MFVQKYFDMAELDAFQIDTVLTPEMAWEIVKTNGLVSLAPQAVLRIKHCRNYLEQTIPMSEKPIYGINTGFGSLCETGIDAADLERLQYNLLRSHACGLGDIVNQEIVRLMLLLKIHGLCQGHSGVQLSTVQALVDLFNLNMTPVVYNKGSLGASGDLAPLANMCLPIIGEGEVWLDGQKMNTKSAMEKTGFQAVRLSSKEGLALINGTQFMSAHLVFGVVMGWRLFERALQIAALSVEAFNARTEPFWNFTHDIRPHKGQQYVGQRMMELLAGSPIRNVEKPRVQDPYSFRCIPQVLGASYQAIQHAHEVVTTEINSVTDNPIIFPDEDLIISGGNFHGQPLAIVLDYLAIALSEIGAISERRVYKFMAGGPGFPPYLAAEPGLNSGFMIAQYAAAAIASANKQLCSPSSVDSIDSSNGQEDHVSMGANGAVKCIEVLRNVNRIIAIEWCTAAQALEFQRPSHSSIDIEKRFELLRKQVHFMQVDRDLGEDLRRAELLLWSELLS